MSKKIDEQIKKINKEIAPFYLVASSNGNYGLCLYINGLKDDFGQEAFDNYAKEKGKPIRDEQGYVTYGGGDEWEVAFMEAFKDDVNLKRISFDSEGSGFYCDGDDLEMMYDFGKRFKAICEDTERFTKIVSDGLTSYETHMKEQEKIRNSVRGTFMLHPLARYVIKTDDDEFNIQAGDAKKMLDGSKKSIVSESGAKMSAEDFLNQRVTVAQLDLFDSRYMKMRVKNAPLEVQGLSIKM